MATGDRRALRHGAKVQIDGYGTVVLDSLDDLPQVKANLDKKFEEVRGFVDTFWGGLSKEDKAAIAVAPVPVLGDAVGLYADAVNYINDPDSRNWLNYTLTLASVLPLVPSATQVRAAKQAKKAINAWHGSPHRFDKFSMQQIGTGEGAQAYGHGLYFAESPDVAGQYRKALSRPAPTGDEGMDLANYSISSARGDRKKALAKIQGGIDEYDAKGWPTPEYRKQYDDALEILKSNKNLGDDWGNLYNVDLDVDPDTLLDWDAPLSEQSAKVQEAVQNLTEIKTLTERGVDYKDLTGQQLYRLIEDSRGNRAYGASQGLLNEVGVPGIRYYDGVSRGRTGGEILGATQDADGMWRSKIRKLGVASPNGPADMVTTSKPFASEKEAMDWASSQIGEGTRNYVIFDDSLINIKSVE